MFVTCFVQLQQPRTRSWYIGAGVARPGRGAGQSQGRVAEATTTKVIRNQSFRLEPVGSAGASPTGAGFPEARGLKRLGRKARHQNQHAHLGGRSLFIETLLCSVFQVRDIWTFCGCTPSLSGNERHAQVSKMAVFLQGKIMIEINLREYGHLQRTSLGIDDRI
jgi:hypothetical protein